MPIIIPANSAASGGFEVANSVRLDFASSTRFERTPSSASNRRTWTFSSWLKKAADQNSNADFQQVFSCPGAGGAERIMFEDNKLTWDFDIAGVYYSVATVAVQRDHSAFYHIVVTKDTTQGTEANRVKMYINGVQQTLAEIQLGFPNQNAEGSINTTAEHQIWAQQDGAEMSGYACETCFVDGTALAADSFGEFDSSSGVWKPIDVSALTLGTNGYFLNYQDSSALGNSSNSNNYTTANLAAIDQTTDTCTNNFATLNPLIKFNSSYSAALSNGSTTLSTSTGDTNSNPTPTTLGITTGKYYWETKFVSLASGTAYALTGIMAQNPAGEGNYLGGYNDSYGYGSWNGVVYNNGGSTGNTTGGATYGVGDILSMAFDADNNRLYYYKNGAIQNSGTGIVIPAASTTVLGAWFPAVGDWGSTTHVWSCNFGSPPYAISSGNQDGNDYGNFEYAVPSGYLSLNTKNLSEALS